MRLPSTEATELEWLCYAQSGVIGWDQACRFLSHGKIRQLVASGRWQRPCRGVLVTGAGELDPLQQTWVALLAAGPEAVLAGLAAARASGLRPPWSQRRDVIDVLVPAARRAPDLLRRLPAEMPAVVVRRTRYLPPVDRQRARPPRTTIERSLVDAARWSLTEPEARAVLAAGCQQRLATPEDLLAVVARMPNLRRRTLIRQTLVDLAGGPDALSEIDLVRLCRRFGLPAPEHQHRRKDAAGRVRYLDAYWPEWGVHVEVDGAHHLAAAQWEADMRRQNDIWIKGDRILRFSAFRTRQYAADVADQIRRALRAAGWPG